VGIHLLRKLRNITMNQAAEPTPDPSPIRVCEALWKALPGEEIANLLKQRGLELSDQLESDRFSDQLMFPSGWRMRAFREEFFKLLAVILVGNGQNTEIGVESRGVHANVLIRRTLGGSSIRLFVYHGDWATGVKLKLSRSMHRVSKIELQDYLPLSETGFDRDSPAPSFIDPDPKPRPSHADTPVLVVLLVHFDHDRKEIRWELGIPSHRDQYGRICGWSERFPLPTISLAPLPPTPQPETPPVDVPVRRKKASEAQPKKKRKQA